jgi:GTPase
MATFRIVEAFAIRDRGTAIVVDFEDDGTVRTGDVARIPVVSGDAREVAIRSVEVADGRDADGRRWGKVVVMVDGVAPDEIARGGTLTTRRE